MFLKSIPKLVRLLSVLFATSWFLFWLPPSEAQSIQPKIDQFLKSKVTETQSRIAVLVARGNDEIIHREYDQNGSNQGALGIRGRLRLPLGTIAEQFLAAVVLRMQEQGKVSLDASMCDYLSSCPNDWREVQIIQLLTHTSGLPLLTEAFPGQSNPAPAQILPEVLAHLGRETLEFKPGSTLRYNKLDYFLLCAVVERTSRRHAREYIENEFFHALKMTDTGFSDRHVKAPLESTSKGSQNSHLGVEETISGTSLRCGDDADSTVEDLLRWARALSKSTIISRDSVLQMFTPFRDGQGFGWKIVKEFNRKLVFQNGRSPGTSVSLRLYPDDDTYVIVASSGINPDSVELTRGVAAILFDKEYPVSRHPH